MLTKPLLTSTASEALLRRTMSPIERAQGRFLRAPDGHEGDGDGGADTGAEGEGQGNEGKADESTVLGGADAGEKAGEEGKGEGEGSAAEGASGPPEKYDLAAPDGFDAIDTEVLAEAEPTLKELKLSNEQAQKLMPIAAQLVKKTMDRAEAAITERAVAQRKEWADAFESDAEIGGANKAKTLADVGRAFDHYGVKPDTGVRQFLNESGLGNHPDLVRFVARVGRDLEEGSFDRGDTPSATKAPEQKMYGPEFQPKG